MPPYPGFSCDHTPEYLFIADAGYKTVGWSMGLVHSSIDLDTKSVTSVQVVELDSVVNEAILSGCVYAATSPPQSLLVPL